MTTPKYRVSQKLDLLIRGVRHFNYEIVGITPTPACYHTGPEAFYVCRSPDGLTRYQLPEDNISGAILGESPKFRGGDFVAVKGSYEGGIDVPIVKDSFDYEKRTHRVSFFGYDSLPIPEAELSLAPKDHYVCRWTSGGVSWYRCDEKGSRWVVSLEQATKFSRNEAKQNKIFAERLFTDSPEADVTVTVTTVSAFTDLVLSEFAKIAEVHKRIVAKLTANTVPYTPEQPRGDKDTEPVKNYVVQTVNAASARYVGRFVKVIDPVGFWQHTGCPNDATKFTKEDADKWVREHRVGVLRQVALEFQEEAPKKVEPSEKSTPFKIPPGVTDFQTLVAIAEKAEVKRRIREECRVTLRNVLRQIYLNGGADEHSHLQGVLHMLQAKLKREEARK